MNEWVTQQVQTTKHRVAVALFTIIVFLSYISPIIFGIGLVVFFFLTSFKLLKKMLLFMLIIGGISVALPFLAPIVLIVMIVLFIMRIGYVIRNWKPFLAGLVVYGGAGIIIARTMNLYGPSFVESIVVAVLSFFVLHYILKWLYRSGYSCDTALGIMGSVPLIIISFVLPFLKLHIGGLEAGHAPVDGGFHTGGESIVTPDGHLVHTGDTAMTGTNLQHVNGYVRAAPDGDPTNNLSYYGPDAKPPNMNDLVHVHDYVRTVPDGDPINNLSYHGDNAGTFIDANNQVTTVPVGEHANSVYYQGAQSNVTIEQHAVPKTTHEKVIDFSQKAVVGQAAVDAMVRELKKEKNERDRG